MIFPRDLRLADALWNCTTTTIKKMDVKEGYSNVLCKIDLPLYFEHFDPYTLYENDMLALFFFSKQHIGLLFIRPAFHNV